MSKNKILSKKGKQLLFLFGVLVLGALSVLIVYLLRSKEIEIGAILPLTGDAAKYGESAKKGINLAIDECNENFGIKGKNIKIIYEDDQADPRTGVSAAQKLIFVDKVQAIIGALPSSVTLAIAPIAEKNRVVILSPASSAPTITHAGDFIFRNVASDTLEGTAMAEFVCNNLKFKSVAILYINNDFGFGLRDSFRKRYDAACGTVLLAESFEQASTDFRSQLSKIKAQNPEAIYLIGYKEMGRILRQAQELGIKCQILSFTMFEDPEILNIAGSIAEGTYYTSRSYDSKAGEGIMGEFNKDYRLKYNAEPDIFAALSYDAAKIIVKAIGEGGNFGPRIKEALYTIKNYDGATGRISFDEFGDVAGSIGIKRVKQGIFVWYDGKNANLQTD